MFLRPPSRLGHVLHNLPRPHLPFETSCSLQQTNARHLIIPVDSWDSHIHVTEPHRFPSSKDALYSPHEATFEQANENASRLQLPKLVFVQPSPYGTDNSCLLDGLQRMGPQHARGVVVCEPDTTTEDTLAHWHTLGVRGVRINLKSVHRHVSKQDFLLQLRKYIDLIRPLRTWSICIYANLSQVSYLESIVKDHDSVNVVLDHFGGPPELHNDMQQFHGWTDLLKLMRQDNVFIKISAPYRFTHGAVFRPAESAVKQLLNVRSGRGVVFASDWPHTRFEGVDISPFVQKCLDWCEGDQKTADALFRDNAERLWDVSPRSWSK